MLAIAAARRLYCRGFDVTNLSVAHLWRFSRIVSSVPSFLVHRRTRPVRDGELSPAVAALYKIGGGPFLTSARMLLDPAEGAPSYRDHVSPAAYLRYTEEHGVFNIADGACAAPPRLVLDFFGNVMHGFAQDPPALAVLVPEIEDEEAFFHYARLCVVQDYIKIHFALGCGTLYAELLRLIPGGPGSERGRRAAHAATEGFGWLFGIGRQIFDRRVLESADAGLLERHAARLRRATATVRTEIDEVLAAGGGDEGRAPGYRLVDLEPGCEPATKLLALEHSTRAMLVSIESEIAASLGWRASDLTEDAFVRGSEAPQPRVVLCAAGAFEAGASHAAHA
jgi:hypothetical protein